MYRIILSDKVQYAHSMARGLSLYEFTILHRLRTGKSVTVREGGGGLGRCRNIDRHWTGKKICKWPSDRVSGILCCRKTSLALLLLRVSHLG